MEEQEVRDIVNQQLFDIAIRLSLVFYRFLKDKDLLDEVMKPPYKDEWDQIGLTAKEMVGLIKAVDGLHAHAGKPVYEA